MGASYEICGHKIRRRSIVKLAPEERAALESGGHVVLARPVEWPCPERVAFMDRAYPDPGGGDWGPGPYLKVPNIAPGEEEVVNRVFCPWGYPPDPVRAFRRKLRMRLECVDLVRVAPAAWEWRLTVKLDMARAGK